MYPESKVKYSIELMRRAEPLALKMNPDGFHLAFSGGKDSQLLYHLAKMAGVKFKAHFQVTTIDPPELMSFVRKNYPDVHLHRPSLNFYQLIRHKKMLPMRQARFCCAYLKEQAGKGTCTLLGIRSAESNRRAKRNELEILNGDFSGTLDQFSREKESSFECVNGHDKIVLSPIFKWPTSEVWTFIRHHKIKYCELYDQGQHRIGCIFCPMASARQKQYERKRYPGIEKQIKKSIQYIQETHPTGFLNKYGASPDEVFDWWISNKTAKQYFGLLRNQLKIPFPDL